MPEKNLNGLVEQHPALASSIFARMDIALNAVLPESKTHYRYAPGEGIGFAAVVASDIVGPGQTYSPFDPGVLDRLTFHADNRDEQPLAWHPNPDDESILGGPIPEGMGRYTAYALAKVNALAMGVSWHKEVADDEVEAEPGTVKIAGGIYLPKTYLAGSGLWEIHDLVAIHVFAREVKRASRVRGLPRSADQIAGNLDSIFQQLKVETDEMTSGKSIKDLSLNERVGLAISASELVRKYVN